MVKLKSIAIISLVISVALLILSIYFANELREWKEADFARNQTAISNYQVSFSNAISRIEGSEISQEQVFFAIKGLNSSMQYYDSVSNLSQSTEYYAVMGYYISTLEEYILANTGGEIKENNYDVDTIIDDLIIIADWLRERNESEILAVHSDDDFYKIYLKLSSPLAREIGAYAE